MQVSRSSRWHHSVTAGGDRSAQHVFCPLWPWPSNSSERGTKHVFPVNLAQIR